MQQFIRAIAAISLALALALPGVAMAQSGGPAPPPDGEIAIVLDVTDGDTIRVERVDGDVERVRYIGVDTPELARDGSPAEPWAQEATEVNADLIGSDFVMLERDVSDRDQFDRLLRYVWVQRPEGWLMINGELVAQGLAEARAYEPDTRHNAWLQGLEREAREAGLGMHGGEASAVEGRNVIDDILDFLFG